MVNKLAGIMNPKDIDRALSKVMKVATGWVSMGRFYSMPRTGWYAQEENASFYLEIPVVSPTLYFTVLSMKSFGPNFIGTNLHIDVNIERAGSNTDQSKDSHASYDISGYHEIKTSVHEPHKFKLAGDGGASPGDVILFVATLTSGKYFKIAGLAFCKQ